MALSREAYRALEDIVGSKYISEEPAILDSYSFQWLSETIQPNQSKFMPRAEAVILPASTRDVQAIVKACNKYKIKIKPTTTGWYFYNAPLSEGVLQIDLRRMDRILDIDEKNMIAVVEPYVVAGVLQAEAMKVGLNITITGAGASCSTLVGATSYFGGGGSAIFCGELKEDLLAAEWVLPNGELLKTGSYSGDKGWFCAEGPGPGTRGLVRGTFGARGGLGIFTKCSVKLAPWPGPTQFPVSGTVPAYRSEMPKNFRAFTLCFPDWESYFEAYYKIYDNEIGYFAHRQWSMLGTVVGPAFWQLYQDPTKSLDHLEEFVNKPEVKELADDTKRSFQLVLVGMTPRDIEHQDKVLDLILAQTKGWKSKKWLEPEMEQFALLFLLRLGRKNLNFVYNGGWVGNFMQGGAPDFIAKYRQLAEDSTAPFQKNGLLVDCGSDSMMGTVGSLNGGGNGGLEQFGFYDVADKQSTQAVIDWMEFCLKECAKNGLPPGKEGMYRAVGRPYDIFQADLAKATTIHTWQRKIKEIVDHNNLCDRMYPTLDEKKP